MKIWLTTDTHFGHKKMLDYCNRPADFEKKIMRGLLQIPEDDVLIHLGDVCIGNDEVHHATWVQKLPIKTKILIIGNHDRKSIAWYLSHGWSFACHGLRLEAFGKKILLSHEPQPDDGWYDVNIHGHFHNKEHRIGDSLDFYTDKHKKLALEDTNYLPITLEKFITG
nr:metallophosphoesterase [Candidatus Sigynarchaeota archaeon]